MTRPYPLDKVCANCPPVGQDDHARCTACPRHPALCMRGHDYEAEDDKGWRCKRCGHLT